MWFADKNSDFPFIGDTGHQFLCIIVCIWIATILLKVHDV